MNERYAVLYHSFSLLLFSFSFFSVAADVLSWGEGVGGGEGSRGDGGRGEKKGGGEKASKVPCKVHFYISVCS